MKTFHDLIVVKESNKVKLCVKYGEFLVLVANMKNRKEILGFMTWDEDLDYKTADKLFKSLVKERDEVVSYDNSRKVKKLLKTIRLDKRNRGIELEFYDGSTKITSYNTLEYAEKRYEEYVQLIGKEIA